VGARRIQEESKRIEAEQERARQEEGRRAAREREQQRLRERAVELLRDVVAADGRLDLGPDADSGDVGRMQASLAKSGQLPNGQRLAQEPTRMDPVLGVTVYLEPDFEALTPLRSFDVPRQLRKPHPAVTAFQSKKALVSKTEIGRAARLLQAFVSAVSDVGWKIPLKVQHMSRGSGEPIPDLWFGLPSRELVLTIRELDERGRRQQAYVTESDYYMRTERTIVNEHFQASGILEVDIGKPWQVETILSIRDTPGASLKEQLPTLMHRLESAEAEAAWSRQEELRRAEISEDQMGGSKAGSVHEAHL
jgi:hypothetical protein